MTTPFVGEIQLFGFNFNPRGWALCNGALLSVQQNTALFSLIGAAYGGNGSTNFALPDFTARAPTEQGRGPGLTDRTIGESFGQPSVTLTLNDMPAHSHLITYFGQTDTSKRTATPATGVALSVPTDAAATLFHAPGPTLDTSFSLGMIGAVGNGQAHPNQQPYLAVNFCIALQGVFPAFQ